MDKQGKGGARRTLVIVALIASAFALGYLIAGMGGPSRPDEHIHEEAARGQKDDIIWTCSMHPQIRLPEPGKCPICFMDLIPVKTDASTEGVEAVSLRQIRLSPEARKLAEVEVSPVERRAVLRETALFGKVDYDETRLGYITTWMAGRIDKLYVDYTGSSVRKGDPMASIYSPELLSAQGEFIQAARTVQEIDKSGLTRMRDASVRTESAAREKLRLLGFTADQIQKVVESGTPSDHITLHSPMSGVVIKKDVLEGMYVQTGTQIYTIADLSRVWVVLEAYESDLPLVRPGMEVEFQTEAYRGEVFRGRIVFVDPVVDEKTRTVRVRLEAANPVGRLKPGMFVRALKQTRAVTGEEPLVIPASAPLVTGKRAIVYVQAPGKEGTYEGKEIVLGPRSGDYYIVRHGLSEGERVVTRGNFKIDSAVQLMARPSMMSSYGGPAVAAHDHGPAETPSQEIPQEAVPVSMFQVPKAFLSNMVQIKTSYDSLQAALSGKDLKKIRDHYKVFYDILCSIDPSPLTGEAALVWREWTMLLGNDAILGSESDSPDEAVRMFATLTEHFEALTKHFPVYRVHEARDPVAPAPIEFRRQLGRLLRVYLALQEALAKDDFTSSQKEGERITAALKNVDMSLVKGEAHHAWMGALDHIKAGQDAITASRDIEGIRKGFEPLSMGMIAAILHLGVDIEGPVLEIFCPMAFDNRGATWLQQDEYIRNPYFGAMMLKCGEVKRHLKSE